MTVLPDELFEWEDNMIKNRIEGFGWNGGYHVY